MDKTGKRLFWLVLLATVALTFVYGVRRELYPRYLDYRAGRAQIDETQRQSQDLQDRIDQARQQVVHLGNDPLELEAAIRLNKGLVRKGETIYRIQTVAEETR